MEDMMLAMEKPGTETKVRQALNEAIKALVGLPEATAIGDNQTLKDLGISWSNISQVIDLTETKLNYHLPGGINDGLSPDSTIQEIITWATKAIDSHI